MTANRFDDITKLFAKRKLSRRSAIRATSVGLAATALGATSLTAQDATPDATPEPTATDKTFFLFVQTATSGSFTANPGVGTPTADGTPVAGGGAEYLLTLEGHGGATVYFSDRPDRIFGEAATEQFLDGLGFSPSYPPNAALVAQTDEGTEKVVVLELLNPTWDEATGALTYGATILDEYTGAGLAHVAARQQATLPPETFGRASLFIDDCGPLPVMVYCTGGVDCLVVGDLGELPLCWTSNGGCQPCIGVEAAADECNTRYAACGGGCAAVPDQFDVAPDPCTS